MHLRLEGAGPLDKDFNEGVRRLCDKYGALLIFDEVVTAFLIGTSGAQGYFGVTPDLTIFGKVIGGGYPCRRRSGRQRRIYEISLRQHCRRQG